ncbi:hypothetical protein ACP4OV_012150 [Aristida adscensionis]
MPSSAPARRPACAACRRIRARCSPRCAYAPHFPAGSWGAMRFTVASGAYGGGRNLAALITGSLPGQGREDVVNMLVYNAARHRGGGASVYRPALARHLAGFARESDAVTAAPAHAAAANSSSAVAAASVPPESVDDAPPVVQQQQPPPAREQAAAAIVDAPVEADQAVDSAPESGVTEDIAGSEHAQEESSAPAAPRNLKRKRED